MCRDLSHMLEMIDTLSLANLCVAPMGLSDLLSPDADAMFIRKTSLQQHPSQVKLSILSVLSLVHRFCAIDPRPCLAFAMASRWLLTQESSDEQEEHEHQPRGVEEEGGHGPIRGHRSRSASTICLHASATAFKVDV